MKRPQLYLEILVVTVLAACQAPQSHRDVSTLGEAKDESKIAGPDIVNVTPFSSVDYQSYNKDSAANGSYFQGAYTRLVVLNQNSPGGPTPKPLRYIDRGVIERYLIGEEFAMNLSVNISAGDFVASIPLVTLDHKSNSDVGEQWTRSLYDTYEAYPFFAVDSSTATPVIETKVTGTIEYSSHVAASALQVAISTAKEVAPSSVAVTSLSKATLKSKANAIDKAIGQLFGKGISEDRKDARDIANWSWGTGFKIVLNIPGSESSFDSQDSAPLLAGQWIITFDDPRPSLFSSWRICQSKPSANENTTCASDMQSAVDKVYSEVSPESILNFQLVSADKNVGLIGQYLSQQTWYAANMTALANASTVEKTAPDFCKNISNTIRNVGLNDIDAGIVVWAVIEGQTGISSDTKSVLVKYCKRWYGPINNKKNIS